MSEPMLRINMTAEQAVRLHEQIEALQQERDHLKAQLAEACGEGRALLAGWISRNQGDPLEQNPIPKEQDAQRQWWEKGWQWREDTLKNDQLQAQLAELDEELCAALGRVTAADDLLDQLRAQLAEERQRYARLEQSDEVMGRTLSDQRREAVRLIRRVEEQEAQLANCRAALEARGHDLDRAVAQRATERQGALAREEAVTEARGLFERAMSALVRNDLAEEAHALARQASWLEVRERVVVLSEGDEP